MLLIRNRKMSNYQLTLYLNKYSKNFDPLSQSIFKMILFIRMKLGINYPFLWKELVLNKKKSLIEVFEKYLDESMHNFE